MLIPSLTLNHVATSAPVVRMAGVESSWTSDTPGRAMSVGRARTKVEVVRRMAGMKDFILVVETLSLSWEVEWLNRWKWVGKSEEMMALYM